MTIWVTKDKAVISAPYETVPEFIRMVQQAAATSSRVHPMVTAAYRWAKWRVYLTIDNQGPEEKYGGKATFGCVAFNRATYHDRDTPLDYSGPVEKLVVLMKAGPYHIEKIYGSPAAELFECQDASQEWKVKCTRYWKKQLAVFLKEIQDAWQLK